MVVVGACAAGLVGVQGDKSHVVLRPALLGFSSSGALDATFGAAGIVVDEHTVTFVDGRPALTATAFDGGLVHVVERELDPNGAKNPTLALTAYDRNGALLWSTTASAIPALAGSAPVLAFVDRTGGAVVIANKRVGNANHPLCARFWL